MDTTEALALCSIAEAADVGLRGVDARTWRGRLDSAREELRPAFECLLDHDRSGALRMATALAEFWRTSGEIPEGRAWLDRSLAAADGDDPALPRALYESALLAFWQGADDASGALLARSLDAARRLRDTTGEAVALCGMARIALREGDLDRARTLCEEALERVNGTDDRLGRSNALHVLGVTAQMRGNLHEAAEFMSRRLQVARELGYVSSIANGGGQPECCREATGQSGPRDATCVGIAPARSTPGRRMDAALRPELAGGHRGREDGLRACGKTSRGGRGDDGADGDGVAAG